MSHSSGLRPADNPFASHRIDRIDYRFPDGTIENLVAALARSHYRGSIVGPHGSGKTTLLERLATRLEGEIVWVRLNSEDRTPGVKARAGLPDNLNQRHVVLVDGAEQLGAWSWWRFNRRTRTAGAVIITSHLQGRHPTIHTCSTDPALLLEMVKELAPDVVETVDFEALFHRQQGNIRLCFRELYHVCSK